MKIIGKIKENLLMVKNKIITGLTLISASQVLGSASAATQLGTTDANAMLGNIIDFILTIANLLGTVFIVVGVFQFALAFKDENPDAKARATTFLIAGIIIFGLKLFLTNAGIIK